MPKLKQQTPDRALPDRPPVPRLSLSVREAAAATGLCKSTLYNLMDGGKLRFVKVGARRLITMAELAALLAPSPQGPEAA